ncbi:MAG TPA: hypothetical protein VIH75_16480 [Candidatus Sulfotelmatobacter sp.]
MRLSCDVQEAKPYGKGVTPNYIRFCTKRLWLDAWKIEFHDNDSGEFYWINQLDGQPAFTHVLHPGGKGLPQEIRKPHRQINFVSKITTMFAFHFGNRDV